MSTPARRDPLVVTLLVALVVLLAVHLTVTTTAVLRAEHQVQEVQAAVKRLEPTLSGLQARMDAVRAGESRTVNGADEVASDTLAKVKALRARRQTLDPIARGPIDKVEQTIALMQLMSDELLVLTEHFARTQGVLTRAFKPAEPAP